MEVTITSANYKEYAEGALPLIIDFWATWCGPCRQMMPVVEEIAKEYEGKLVVGKCNIDEEEDIPMQHGIRSIPTILFIKNGQVVDKTVGSVPKNVLVEKLQNIL